MDCLVHWAIPSRLVADAEVLDAVERRRAAAFVRAADRVRFVAAACLLRAVAARELGVVPAAVAVDRTCPDCGAPHGRPAVGGLVGDVSVSHSGDRVVVALVRRPTGRVGVDVELLDPALDVAALAGQVYAPGELPARTPSPAELIDVWTRKEAVLKATGDGLRVPMSALTLARDGSVVRYPGRSDVQARAVGIDVGDGYRAACAVLDDSGDSGDCADASVRVVLREIGSLSGW